MSVEATSWAWAWRGLSATQKVVLVRIADHASPDGSNAWPSVEKLTLDTGLSERAVRNALRQLEDLGAIKCELKAGPKGCNRYTVYRQPPADDSTGTSCPRQDVPPASGAAQPAPDDRSTGTSCPQTVRNHQEPSEKETSSLPLALVPPTEPHPIELVFNRWRESTGKDRARLDTKRRRRIEAALKAYPLADVLDAVVGWRNSPFHCGHNDRNKAYNDLDLLLRDARRIEEFRDLARAGPQPSGPAATKIARTTDALRDFLEAES